MNRWSRRRTALAAVLAVVTVAGAVTLTEGHRPGTQSGPVAIGGPYAAMLADSTDLGPSRGTTVRLTAALNGAGQPSALMRWAQRAGLSVRWRPGDTWALLEGDGGRIEEALGVPVHDYRGRRGQLYYASPRQPVVPTGLRTEVAGLGRILSYTPHHESWPWPFPKEVPGQGLTPDALLQAYNVQPLRDAGYTGKGVTVVVFGFDGFDQADLDMFSTTFNLPQFTPEVVGDRPSEVRGETTMDLQAVHALAPDAKKVLVNARPTVTGDASYVRIAEMMEDTTARYPGAVWSFSIGWGCDKLITAADLEPVRAAMRNAHRTGTTAFNASGDLAGLECKGGEQWSSPPSDDNVGLDAVASLP